MKAQGVLKLLLQVVGGLCFVIVIVSVLSVLDWRRVERQRLERQAQAFARLPPSGRGVALYDAFCEQISAHYYDQRFTGMDWKAVRAAWRVKAAAAHNDFELYNVLGNMGLAFPVSHVGATPPIPPAVPQPPPAGTAAGKTAQPRIATDFAATLGFRFATIRRGGSEAITVTDVRRGSSAESAGIQPGWYVEGFAITPVGADREHFDGTFATPETAGEVASLDRGLKIDFSGWPDERRVRWMRANNRHISFDAEYVPKGSWPGEAVTTIGGSGVTYIRLDSFMLDLANRRNIDGAMRAIDRAGPAGIILDLRENAGGLHDQAVRLLSRFLPREALIGFQQTATKTTSQRPGIFSRRYQGPLVVLIGPASASAAEVVASALQLNHRAKLIGRATGGSLMFSQGFPLPDGGSVRVPVAAFLDAHGKPVEGVGVVPDIETIPTLAAIRSGHDSALERAAAELALGAHRRAAQLP